MKNRVLSAVALVAAAALVTATVPTPNPLSREGLTVHEWGTFTTVAGEDGRAIDWFPLGGPSDLPCFVDRFQNRPLTLATIAASALPLPNLLKPMPANGPLSITGKVAGVTITAMSGRPGDSSIVQIGPPARTPVRPPASPFTAPALEFDYEATRANVRGKVRMETPVIYFYSAREVTANVRVDFPRGLMTEWYPSATVTQGNVGTATLSDPSQVGTIEWKNILVAPTAKSDFLNGSGPSHYFAARATDAAPLAVNGQTEKFLFYRGVANFDVPISASLTSGGAVVVRNLGAEAIPAVILFENRGGRIGFRVHTPGVPVRGDLTLAAPELGANFATLRRELEQLLVGAGLFQKEAASMVETWRDSWFEEGTRVLYLFGDRTVDATLPLTISPVPVKTARVFVGRMELVTPALQQAVALAVATDDTVVLTRTARFFGPISDRILARGAEPATAMKHRQTANTLLTSYVHRLSNCQ